MLSEATPTAAGSLHLGAPPVLRLPDATVLAEGGAICASLERGAHVPSIEVVQGLCDRVPPRIRNLFGEIEISAPKNGLCMSSEVSLDRIEEFVRRVRHVLQEQRRNVIALVGSHKAPRFASALTVGLSPDDLDAQQNGAGDAKLSVVLATSRYCMDIDPIGVHETVEDAFRISADPNMQGRAGVLFGRHLYSLPSLRRPQEPVELHSRFLPIADKNRSNQWQFSTMRSHHQPIGERGSFELEHRVKTFVLGGESDVRPDAVVDAIFAEKCGGELQGMVIKNTEFRNPFVTTDPEILATIDRVGIPGIVVGDSNDQDNDVAILGSTYPHLLDGRNLYSGEAKLLLAFWLKGAINAGCFGVEETTDYIRQKLEAYPFR